MLQDELQSVALNFYASGSFQRSTGDMCGISQAAIYSCIKEVTNALLKRADDYVHYWTNPDSQAERAIGFGTTVGFPQMQGVIDCTHVAIKAPTDQPAIFINREGFHSINVQLVCNHRKHLLQVCPHFPGAATTPRYFKNPRFHSFSGPLLTFRDGFLWTRATHSQLKPVGNPHNAAEERYNTCHSSIRATTKHVIGLLKVRFRCLDRSSGALQYAPARVLSIVAVCYALHSLALQRGEALHQEDMLDCHSSSDEENMEEGVKQVARDDKATVPEVTAIERCAREAWNNLTHTRFPPP
ncbi:putative nuclease HARBI1 [Heterodontus francisci]|uniref:putative nuclease HARBI1 n=1 Tax=Heterodontus francisci TaxID=7792 RepID=UPI00355C4D6E